MYRFSDTPLVQSNIKLGFACSICFKKVKRFIDFSKIKFAKNISGVAETLELKMLKEASKLEPNSLESDVLSKHS